MFTFQQMLVIQFGMGRIKPITLSAEQSKLDHWPAYKTIETRIGRHVAA